MREQTCRKCGTVFQTGSKRRRNCSTCEREVWRRNKGLPPISQAIVGDEYRLGKKPKRLRQCRVCSKEFMSSGSATCFTCSREAWRARKGLPPIAEASPGDEEPFKRLALNGEGKKCSRCGEVYVLEAFITLQPIKIVHHKCETCRSKEPGELYFPDSYKEEIRSSQDHKCAVCGQEEESGRRLAIDHDHVSGRIRGALCQRHNQALGMVRDSISELESMITYLKKFE